MEKKDKELLLQDLCARLPYGVMCEIVDNDENLGTRVFPLCPHHITYIRDHRFLGEEKDGHWKSFKPILRSLTDMTKEEKEELCKMCTPVEVLDPDTQAYFSTHYYVYFGAKDEDNPENNPYK